MKWLLSVISVGVEIFSRPKNATLNVSFNAISVAGCQRQ